MKFQGFLKKNGSFFLFVIGLFAFRWSLADQNLVPTGSMEPTIHVGDRIVVNKTAYDLRVPFTDLIVARVSEPQRGDIVVFMNPRNEERMVKRLIGLPGDHLVIRDGFISVNGKPLEGTEQGMGALENRPENEIYYREQVGSHEVTVRRTHNLFREDRLDLVVPTDHYFMMGDNRDNSYDSRGWGLVPRSHLRGKAFGVALNLMLSLDEWPRAEWDRIAKAL